MADASRGPMVLIGDTPYYGRFGFSASPSGNGPARAVRSGTAAGPRLGRTGHCRWQVGWARGTTDRARQTIAGPGPRP